MWLIKTAANASPIARVSVVLAVGTIPSGSTSLEIEASITRSTSFDKTEFIFPKMPISGDLNSFNIGNSLSISSVAPLFEMRIVGSPGA